MHGPLNVKILNKSPLFFFVTCVDIVRIVESGEACTLKMSKKEYERSIWATLFEYLFAPFFKF
jgi:hypothetical protein